jgi:hypothetical protein
MVAAQSRGADRPATTVLTSCTGCLPLGRERAAGGTERGGDMCAGAAGRPLPPGGAKRRRVLDEAGSVREATEDAVPVYSVCELFEVDVPD